MSEVIVFQHRCGSCGRLWGHLGCQNSYEAKTMCPSCTDPSWSARMIERRWTYADPFIAMIKELQEKQ